MENIDCEQPVSVAQHSDDIDLPGVQNEGR